MSVETHVNERLAALTAAGTSVWLDQIRRSLITGGELERLVREDSLRGVTSNPAIFEKAILGSSDYDDQIAEAAENGLDATQIYEEIAIKDVQMACDVLRPVWDEPDGADGFVSLEVEPAVAHDTDRTIEQAREFWKRVDRPNVMIKIPGTDEGVPAIEQCLTDGININITLLFSVEAYERVIEAYLKAMETRRQAGESLDVHSVASFFVSRVDTEVDKRLDELGREDLRGTAAVANARAAYRSFKEVFRGERFAELREAGCPVQRPLWASTGVKDPQYPETKYVETLVGPDTVNTMPMPTLLACAEQLEVTGPTADQDPSAELEALTEAGIDMKDVTDKLLKRRHRQVRRALRRADRGHRDDARGHRHRAAAHDRGLDPRRAGAGDHQARGAGGRGAGGQPRSGSTTSRSGAARACRRSATAWAGSRSARRCSSTPPSCRSSSTRSRPRASPTPCCSAWAARASAPR